MTARRVAARAMQDKKTENIAEDVYVGFVRSLFNDPTILLIGAFCHGLMGFLTYYSSAKPVYLLLASAMLFAGLYRYYGIKKAQRAVNFGGYQTAQRWERYYLVGGTLQAFFMGLFCLFTMYFQPNTFGEVAAIAVIMGSSVTIVGRNYGSKKMVAVQAIVGVLPIAIGLMLKGDVISFILGLYIVPFIYIITRMGSHVRTVLFNAISQRKMSEVLAERFNRALNTMSHGLVMLNPQGRIVVANGEAAKTLMFADPNRMLGRTLGALTMRGVAGRMLSAKDGNYVETQLTRALGERRDRKILVRLLDGRHLEFSASQGEEGLGVITFEDVSARIEAEERIRTMARYDGLTTLPNRSYFHEFVTEMIQTGDRNRLSSLVVFDLDDFKSINDTLGHPIGDGLIYAVAERLSRYVDDNIKISRFGGDEFMMYIDRVDNGAHLGRILDEIFAGLHGDVDIAGHALRIQASAGAVLACVKDTNVDEMIVKADLALYKAKELGKNTWRLFESAMDAAFRSKQLMKADLRNAVDARGLRVVFQPIVAMDTMRITGAEALCRWDHPELGPISPAIFIPLAEEMGIVSDISTFVLEAACAECVKWPEQICVSVNLSAKDFRNRDIIGKVREALALTGLAAHRLEIEVTETALLDDKSLTSQYIEELKLLGVRISLDDFGTGYSSLSYLHKLPLDKVKIDRSFLLDVVQNKRSLDLLSGIVELARTLGLSVTMEGVETFEQLKILATSVKPDLVQGFLFGAPLSASSIATMSKIVWPFAGDLRPVQQIANS